MSQMEKAVHGDKRQGEIIKFYFNSECARMRIGRTKKTGALNYPVIAVKPCEIWALGNRVYSLVMRLFR